MTSAEHLLCAAPVLRPRSSSRVDQRDTVSLSPVWKHFRGRGGDPSDFPEVSSQQDRRLRLGLGSAHSQAPGSTALKPLLRASWWQNQALGGFGGWADATWLTGGPGSEARCRIPRPRAPAPCRDSVSPRTPG